MIHSVMLYGTVLGLTLAVAAHCLDRGLRILGRPTRWIWAGAMTGMALAPLASLFLPQEPGGLAESGSVIPLAALYEMWDVAVRPGAGGASLVQALNGPLLFAWLTGSLLVTLLFLGGALRLRKQARGWDRGKVGEEDILISDGLGPAVLGLLYPRIVLPPWALSLHADQLDMVLLHEAEHRGARDPALLGGGILMVALAPWNPALWWALGRLRLAVEGDCDRRVVARGVPRGKYGQLLLGVASGSRGLFPLAPALTEGGRTSLERRLRMMRNTVGKKKILGSAAAVAAGGLLLAVACETPTPPQGSPDQVSEAPLPQAGEPVADAGAPWAVSEVDDPSGTVEKVRLKEIPEDGIVSVEAGQAEIGATPSHTRPGNGAKVIIREAPAGAQGVVEANPLILIDDVVFEGAEAKAVIGELNPADIESIEVIKGKAAEALYGERAADGVIRIRLKK